MDTDRHLIKLYGFDIVYIILLSLAILTEKDLMPFEVCYSMIVLFQTVFVDKNSNSLKLIS